MLTCFPILLYQDHFMHLCYLLGPYRHLSFNFFKQQGVNKEIIVEELRVIK